MRLTAIEVRGFRAFASTERFDVDADAIIVSAANGRGKTSLFDAVLWGISGVIPRLRDDGRKVVSLYSPSGEASVLLEFRRRDGSEYRIRRSSNNGEVQLRIEANDSVSEGAAARVRLLEDVWPNALAVEDSEAALADMVTRGVYLQQDLVRQFIEADTEAERFEVVNVLIGAARVTEMQKQLESSRKSWSTATNSRKRDEDGLRARLQVLESELAGLSGPGAAGGRDGQALWQDWWQDAAELGVAQRYPSLASTLEAQRALDSGVKQLQVLRRTAERRLDVAAGLASENLSTEAVTLEADLGELERAFEAARARTRVAREALQAAEVAAAELRRTQVEQREERAELQVLARLAQRHLGEHCPVCTQPFDRDRVRRHLEDLIREGGESAPGALERESGSEVSEAAAEVTRCEAEEARIQGVLGSAERSVEGIHTRIQERERKLGELGIEGDVESVVRAQEELSRLIERLRNHEAAGESLGLVLAQAGEQARRAELENQVEDVRRQVEELQQEIALRSGTSRVVDSVVDGLRDIASEIVSSKLTAIDPILRRVYARIDPHPAFREAEIRTSTSYGRGRLAMRVYDSAKEVFAEPLRVLSSSQMNALAVSIFLSFNLGMSSLSLRVAILDDPLQSLDDVNLLGVSDLLRRMKAQRQLFVSTHDARFSHLLQRKLRPTDSNQRTRLIELEGWNREGPTVVQTDVPADERAVRIVA